jgi:RNA polymerase sigma factor (TIGR02999 family)
MPADEDITGILQEWDRDPKAALNRLTPVVYRELRGLAAAYMRRERPDHTLQPTALLHEAWLRLAIQTVPGWKNRAHFFGVAAHIMRQVLVDFARRHGAQKRDAGTEIQFDSRLPLAGPAAEDFLALDAAIEKLKQWDARKSQVIELRYFGGMRRDEIAATLSLTVATVKRDLSVAEAFLRRELGYDSGSTAAQGYSV